MPHDEASKHLSDPDSHLPAPSVPSTVPNTTLPVKPTDAVHGSHFDLVFVRWSMVLDGFLTGLFVFANQGWHMYVAAAVLPFASGTAPAAKGVVMELVNEDEKGGALAGIALLETTAAICTVSGFGFLFSYLSEIGRAQDVFAANAAVALVAAGFLLCVRFPRVKRDAVV